MARKLVMCSGKLAALLAALAVSLLASCTSPVAGMTAGDGATGSLALTFAGAPVLSGARTIVPAPGDLPALASYDVVVSRALFADRTATFSSSTGSVSGLEPGGPWTVAVSGKTAGGLVIATGSGSVTIALPGPTAATVNLDYVAAAAGVGNTGAVAITLLFPKTLVDAGAAGVEATLDGVAVSPALTVADNGDSVNDKVVYAASGLASASSRLIINLKKNSVMVLPWSEQVWVYRNITTTKTETLLAAAFSAAPSAPISLTASLQADGSVNLGWPNVGTAESYALERSAGEGGSWTVLDAALAAGSTSTTDSPTILEESYRYRLSATNNYGTSGYAINLADVAVTPVFIVAYDKAALAVGYHSGDTATAVTQNVILAATASAGTTISWSSTSTAIATDGTVTRPAFPVGDKTGNLTATISNHGASDTKAFTSLVVLKAPQTDAEAVADGKSNLAISYGGSDTINSVRQNITLTASGTSGTAVNWATTNSAYISASGGVTQPAQGVGDQAVTLTATVSKGSSSDTKVFGPITVLQIAAGYYIAGDGSGGGGAGDYSADYGQTASGGNGGGGNDTITGTAGNDVIFGDGSGGGGGGTTFRNSPGGAGGSGADSINGGGGNDIIFGDGFNGMSGLKDANGVAGGFGGGGGGGGFQSTGSGGNGGLLAGGGGGNSGYSAGSSLYGGYSGGAASKPAGGTTNQTDASWGGNSAIPSAGYGQSLGGTCYNAFGAGGGAGLGGLNDQLQAISVSGSNYDNGGSPQGGNGSAGTTAEVSWNDSSVGLYNYVHSQLPTIFISTPGTTNGAGSGNDIINGGAGSDDLFGLGGNDTFVFELNDAGASDTDTVWDFNFVGTDALRLTIGGTLISTAVRDALVAAQTTPSGTDRQIVFSGTGKQVTILIKKLNRNLASGDFQ